MRARCTEIAYVMERFSYTFIYRAICGEDSKYTCNGCMYVCMLFQWDIRRTIYTNSVHNERQGTESESERGREKKRMNIELRNSKITFYRKKKQKQRAAWTKHTGEATNNDENTKQLVIWASIGMDLPLWFEKFGFGSLYRMCVGYLTLWVSVCIHIFLSLAFSILPACLLVRVCVRARQLARSLNRSPVCLLLYSHSFSIKSMRWNFSGLLYVYLDVFASVTFCTCLILKGISTPERTREKNEIK